MFTKQKINIYLDFDFNPIRIMLRLPHITSIVYLEQVSSHSMKQVEEVTK